MSAEHTSRFLVPFLRWLNPDISLETLAFIHFMIRKLGHVTEYAILAILLWRAVYRGMNLKVKMSILAASVWLAATLVAASDEFHQSFVPSRDAAWGDVLVDSGGAIFGLLIAGRKRSEGSKMSAGKFSP